MLKLMLEAVSAKFTPPHWKEPGSIFRLVTCTSEYSDGGGGGIPSLLPRQVFRFNSELTQSPSAVSHSA